MKCTRFCLIIASLLVLVVQGCEKHELPEVYVGRWVNNATTLIEIDEDGNGSYSYHDGTNTDFVAGEVIVKDGKLKICSEPLFCKTFNIDQEPIRHEDQGYVYYHMILSGEDFWRD